MCVCYMAGSRQFLVISRTEAETCIIGLAEARLKQNNLSALGDCMAMATAVSPAAANRLRAAAVVQRGLARPREAASAANAGLRMRKRRAPHGGRRAPGGARTGQTQCDKDCEHRASWKTLQNAP